MKMELMPQGDPILGLDESDVASHLDAWGVRQSHARVIWQRAHRQHNDMYDDAPGLPNGLAERVRAELPLQWPVITRETHSSDGYTRKLLLTLDDGAQIETVLMRYDGRATVCVSTQAGCAMGCVFCATGQMGFRRHLTTAEIVAQVYLAGLKARPTAEVARPTDSALRTVRNVVFMGMGEPLHNYAAVMKATEILSNRAGLGLSPRRLTVSTVGVAPAIRQLAAERRPISLAVSLHAATQDGRLALLPPAARAWSLDDVMDACREYSTALDRHIFFEWTLIAGRNDQPDDAHALGRLLSTQRAHVNLIPLNPTRGYDGVPAASADAKAFQAVLAGYGIPSTVRQRRGIDIDSGCGQLVTAESSRPVSSAHRTSATP